MVAAYSDGARNRRLKPPACPPPPASQRARCTSGVIKQSNIIEILESRCLFCNDKYIAQSGVAELFLQKKRRKPIAAWELEPSFAMKIIAACARFMWAKSQFGIELRLKTPVQSPRRFGQQRQQAGQCVVLAVPALPVSTTPCRSRRHTGRAQAGHCPPPYRPSPRLRHSRH